MSAALGLLAPLSACAPQVAYRVDVDALTAPEFRAGPPTFVVLPGDADADQLVFQEFASCVERALVRRGYQRATREQANIVVLLSYGIGAPQTTAVTRSMPLLLPGGPSTSTFQATTLTPAAVARTIGTIQQPAQPRIAGTISRTDQYTTYLRHLVLNAYDAIEYRTTGQVVEMWRTVVTSRGSSGDLRRVLPVLVGAAERFIGKNTGGIVSLSIPEDDPRITRARGDSGANPPQ